MAENDSRLQAAEAQARHARRCDAHRMDAARGAAARATSRRQRQVGTKQVTDSNGNTQHRAVYEYGRNKPTVIDEGAATVRARGAARLAGAGR